MELNVLPLVKKLMAAPEAVMITAEEAVPAIAGGILGVDRTDTRINPKLEQAIKTTAERAKKKGAKKFGYSDFDSTTPGGLAARLTVGDVAMSEMTFDEDGNATGITQKFDTNKTPQEALSEFDPTNIKTYYKPAEALLASVQSRGLTTHDVDLNGSSTPEPRMAAEADITVDGAAEPGPATNYAVQAGDTLSSIARANNTTVQEIVRKNKISNPDLISVGDQINF